MRTRILVVIPAYCCADRIGRVLAQFDGPIARHIDEALVLDDCSPDETLAVARQAAVKLSGLRVKIARNRERYDLGGSHKAAFAYADAEDFSHVVVLDGNDRADIRDFLPVIGTGAHLDYDAVFGARVAENASALRSFGRAVLPAIYSRTTGQRIDDIGSGLNLYARSVIADPATIYWPDDARFVAHLLLSLADARRPILFHPVGWRDDDGNTFALYGHFAWQLVVLVAHFALRRQSFRAGDRRKPLRDSYAFDLLWLHDPHAEQL